ncbi:MAG: DNA-protecting protein DprA [Firmicutes bacterium]|nr:DNA-protecting protein DprA [Bacillota bacterium]
MANDKNIDLDKYKIAAEKNGYKIISINDEGFTNILFEQKPNELPAIFAYKGDITLLSDRTNNIAVVGVLTPDKDIIERERKIIENLAFRKKTIISGLAVGCDTAAHEYALEFGAKTVAFLPSTLEKIYPKQNRELAKRIVEAGGLLVTEYITEPPNRFETIKRFIQRDRLQALFSSAAILIASYRKGEGDSGSRHCMQYANKYGRKTYVMYNAKTDSNRAVFGLNADLAAKGCSILTLGGLNEL